MWLNHKLRCQRSLPKTSRSPARRRRLWLEPLEDRLAPAVLTVNAPADTASPTDPYLSLREAVAIVNSATLPGNLSAQIRIQITGILHAGGMDTIRFSSGLDGTPITLKNGQLELRRVGGVVSIIGNGQDATIIQLNDPNYLLRKGRVFQVDRGVNARLGYLTIQGGQLPSDYGGAVWNAGTLQIAHCYVQHSDAYDGGAIYNGSGGNLTLDSVSLTKNTATSVGGGIASWGTLVVTGSIIANNQTTGSGSWGGGIFNDGTATIGYNPNTGMVSGCDISSNAAQGDGGGIFNEATLNVLNNTYVQGNTAAYGGGICTEGNATVTASVITANTASSDGGGILNTATLRVNGGSWVENNRASYGGGIDNGHDSTTIVDASTLYNNRADNHGGGVENGGALYMWNGAVIESNGAYTGGGIDNGGIVWLNLNPLAPYSTSAPYQFSQGNQRVWIEGNHVSGYGGGIYNAGTTSMYNTVVELNGSGSNGGGIYNSGKLPVSASWIESNTANGDGGGLYNTGVASVANGSYVDYNVANTGAGIDNLNQLGVANHVVIEYNHANWNGGGIANWSSASVYGTCFIEYDTAVNDGGGIYSGSSFTVSNCYFAYDSANNVGGGICDMGGSLYGNPRSSCYFWGNHANLGPNGFTIANPLSSW